MPNITIGSLVLTECVCWRAGQCLYICNSSVCVFPLPTCFLEKLPAEWGPLPVWLSAAACLGHPGGWGPGSWGSCLLLPYPLGRACDPHYDPVWRTLGCLAAGQRCCRGCWPLASTKRSEGEVEWPQSLSELPWQTNSLGPGSRGLLCWQEEELVGAPRAGWASFEPSCCCGHSSCSPHCPGQVCGVALSCPGWRGSSEEGP